MLARFKGRRKTFLMTDLEKAAGGLNCDSTNSGGGVRPASKEAHMA